MSATPSVSVIIPTHNRAGLIGETLASVCAQTFTDFEIIVADDGSSDNTEEVVASLRDPRIRYIRLRYSGGRPAGVRNAAIDLSRGRYVAFLDSDDLWLPHKLETQIPYMDAHPEVGFVFTNAEAFSGADRRWRLVKCGLNRKQRLTDLLLDNFIPILTVVARRSSLQAVGGLCEEPEVVAIEDYDLWLRLATRFPFHYLPVITARYRVHGENLQANDMIGSDRRRVTVLRRLEGKLNVPEMDFRRGLAANYRRLARAHAYAGNQKEYLETLAASWESARDWKTGALLFVYRLTGFNASRRAIAVARHLKSSLDRGLWWLQSKSLDIKGKA